ncbi:5784_t:CDS:2, partial [Dentiscutata erythropus]
MLFRLLHSFIVKQYPQISPDFENADILVNTIELLSKFEKNIRNKMVHGIIVDEKGGDYKDVYNLTANSHPSRRGCATYSEQCSV